MNSNTNRMTFDQFKEIHDEWLVRLTGDDFNSITKQIARMLWDAAVFGVIREARKLATSKNKSGQGKNELNWMMYEFINSGFGATQSLAIRRLTDPKPAKGKEGVYSLCRLLKDMETNSNHLTRDYLLKANGFPYEYKSIEDAFWQNSSGNNKSGFPKNPPKSKWAESKIYHQHIDELTGVTENERTPGDTIRKEIFEILLKKLRVCDDVRVYSNKFIAHAATPESRSSIKPEQLRMMLRQISDAHKSICEVANFISIRILGGGSLGGLSKPQFDQLKFLEKPLVKSEDKPKLEEIWKQFDREVQKWGNWKLDDSETESQ